MTKISKSRCSLKTSIFSKYFIIVFIFIAKAFRDLDKKTKQENEKVFPKNNEINVLINENV